MRTARDVRISPSSPSAESPADARIPRLECRPAESPEELAAHYAIRHQVFVREQAIFPVDDRDSHDDSPDVIHVVGLVDGLIRGAVRLYPIDHRDGLWKGDRLAVLNGHRHHHLGAMLVNFAVRTAGRRGGREMVAHVQLGNVRFFEHLGWHRDGEPEDYVGIRHQRMVIPLTGSATTGGRSPSPT